MDPESGDARDQGRQHFRVAARLPAPVRYAGAAVIEDLVPPDSLLITYAATSRLEVLE